jgi:hypothetical protein
MAVHSVTTLWLAFGCVLVVCLIVAALLLYRMYLETWRLYPLQSALKAVVSGFIVLCINFVLPTVNIVLPFSITIRTDLSLGPGNVSFAPPPDWILFGALVLVGTLTAWLAYLNYKHTLPALSSGAPR